MDDPELKTGRDDAPKVDQPNDLTIIVGQSEFAVHKAVLTSASPFFREMFSAHMVESQTNRVILQGFDAGVIRKLIEFAYTGDEGVISDNPMQLLQCASYLQMPAAIEACTKRLVSCLSPTNCMEALSTFVSLSLESGVQNVNDYIKSNIKLIEEQFPVRSAPLRGVQVMLDHWHLAEIKAFRYKNRTEHINDLMCRVRFGLMTRMEISVIKRNRLYKSSKGPWCELVDKAQEYQKLPMHLRVIDKSLQTTVRGEPSHVMLTRSKMYYVLNKEEDWVEHQLKAKKKPKFRREHVIGLEVNNFFIMYADIMYDWFILDPRTKTLSQMDIQQMMLMLERDFILFHRDDHLYTIGGRLVLDPMQKGSRRYSFATNSWTVMPYLPVYVEGRAACLMGDRLYVCGGYIEDFELEDCEDEGPKGEPVVRNKRFFYQHYFFASSRLYSIDFLSESPVWTRHKSCPKILTHHRMEVVEEVIAVRDEHEDVLLYDPVSDQWTMAEKGYEFPEHVVYDPPFPQYALYDRAVLLTLPPSTTTKTRTSLKPVSKMVDVGLTAGVEALRQGQVLLDLIINIDSHEFKVHKFIMASVSEYFREMLNESQGSKIDTIELKDVSAEIFSHLIDFIYTRNGDIISANATELLGCALQFEMQAIVKLCVEELLLDLEVHCIDTLSTFLRYLLYDEVKSVKKFMKYNQKLVSEQCIPSKMTYEMMLLIMDYWGKSEWDLFILIKNWINVDSASRKKYMDYLFGRIRFCLMPVKRLKSLKTMDIYKDSHGSWGKLVKKALKYHKLPIHQKVLAESEQSKVRGAELPVFFATGPWEKSSTFYVLDKKNRWRKNAATNTLRVSEQTPVSVVVNNFLITCTVIGTKHWDWYIFDARTLTWSEMANMTPIRKNFALVAHGEHLYVLGGRHQATRSPNSIMSTVDQYSFRTNTWSRVENMPYRVECHAACVLGDTLYTCGGEIYNEKPDCFIDRMDCLDVASQKWTSKAPMLKPKANHLMYVMTICNEETIVVIDREFEIDFYNPVTDQWSHCNYVVRKDIGERQWIDGTVSLAKGNTVVFLNILGSSMTDSEPDDNYSESDVESLEADEEPREFRWDRSRKYACLKWKVPVNGRVISQAHFGIFPAPNNLWVQSDRAPFGGVLAIPMHTFKKSVGDPVKMKAFFTTWW